MKKWTKVIAVLSMLLVFTCLLGSCSSNYDFYKDWHDAGADIEEDNIFKTVTLEEAQKLKEDKETFALVYASSVAVSSVSLITSLQAQAEYLGHEDATIYYLNSTDYTTVSKCKEVNAAINMNDAGSFKDGTPVVMTFKKGIVDVDTSNPNLPKTKEFIKNSVVQYSSLASYIFKELLA